MTLGATIILAIGIAVASGCANQQRTAAVTTAPPGSSSGAAAAPSGAGAAANVDEASDAPSQLLLRQAREAGYKVELHNGVTQFCIKEDKADTGTHFAAPKRCFDKGQMIAILDQRQQNRDTLRGMTQTNPTSK
jgi:hypothetical protein